MEITRRSFAAGATALAATTAVPLPALSLETAPVEILSPEVAASRVLFRNLFQTWWNAHLRMVAVETAWEHDDNAVLTWTDEHEVAERAHRQIFYRYFDHQVWHGPEDTRFQSLVGRLLHDKIYTDETLDLLRITEEQAHVITSSDTIYIFPFFEPARRGRVAQIV